MPDETEQTQETEQTTETTQQTEQVTETQATETPHPLQPGGARFEEVYARMRQAEDRAARAEGMYQQSLQQQRPQPQGPVYVDPNQLQALVDQGRITPMQAADILSRQNAQAAATQTVTQAVQMQTLAGKLQVAKTEVDQYISKIPSLRDNTSQDFQRVSEEAYRLSDDMGLPVTDLRVQRAALRATYGTLDRIASTQQAREQSRTSSLPHVETRSGGRPIGNPNGNDPLKDVDPTYIQFWERRGYTREQMIEEAQYIPKGRKVRFGGR